MGHIHIRNLVAKMIELIILVVLEGPANDFAPPSLYASALPVCHLASFEKPPKDQKPAFAFPVRHLASSKKPPNDQKAASLYECLKYELEKCKKKHGFASIGECVLSGFGLCTSKHSDEGDEAVRILATLCIKRCIRENKVIVGYCLLQCYDEHIKNIRHRQEPSPLFDCIRTKVEECKRVYGILSRLKRQDCVFHQLCLCMSIRSEEKDEPLRSIVSLCMKTCLNAKGYVGTCVFKCYEKHIKNLV